MHLICPSCLAKNRVPEERLLEHPSCGKCGTDLMKSQPIALNDENFPRYTEGTQLPVLVDFWADWCGPCKMIAPALEEIAQSLGPKAKIVKINIDDNPSVPSRYGVRGIPTLMVFKGGQVAATKVGAAPKAALATWIQSAI